MQAEMPSRQELLVGFVLALGILCVILTLRVVPPPWGGWFTGLTR
jgi:hypothetical protein